VAGTTYPIINAPSSAVTNAYNITYWPTIYAVCPDRKIFEAGQISYNSWLTWIQTCSLDGDAVATDVVCVDEINGSINLTTTGGFGSLSYTWSNGATTQDLSDLLSGSYSVTITEGHGYSIERGPFMVDGPASAVEVVTNLVQDVDCNGNQSGEINTSGTGGVPGYSYDWSSGQTTANISNLSPGSYLLTLTDNNNCTDTALFMIEEPPVLENSSVVQDENCGNGDGEIIAQASGGSPFYTYDIGLGPESTGYFPDLSEGIYYLTVSDDNGCTVEESIVILNNPPPVADAGADETIDCASPQQELNGTGSSSGTNIT
jgi:hypothetical protein